ncbi:hypothetical protein [Streptomyces pluripotens]|uniref:hypothetical protein n=1 Tax=Streptomyces pluripotens TaxID=1355015 RepID=UPI0005838B92|nr:hypothetical protein [Streptomyces pluripotens]ARP71351.1 hypothetical protein LK06_016830 [Streptomyces pluripotens]
MLHDLSSGRAYFLTRPGTARIWHVPDSTALGSGSWVVLAPPGWDGLLRWVSGPCDGPAFTEAEDLVTALAMASLRGPAEEAGR